ncbi:glycosyltransferase [Amycolatopsis albispora]|uniref:Glycosyltransferase n=1 Tax=Amycolatopsis albispora TaxID=1804986 RepID=A0A344LK76_9PSEU|nr:glycosyltransferase [Amycolatopsis albispora]
MVSVITPVHPPSLAHLDETYRSLAAQELPAGWSWEWLVQADGDGDLLTGRLPDDPRVRPGHNRKGGPGVTRTMAAGRARGELVKNLDADDLLLPGALAREITALADESLGWTTCKALDLLPDGSHAAFDDDPAEGVLAPGSVLRHWRTHNHRPPVHGTTLCLRRDLLLMLGGWSPLPASEDTGLLLAANAVAPGYFIATPGLLYRKWPGQVTQSPAHTDPDEQRIRMHLIGSRAEALLARFTSNR